jgi:hypothetical protein
VNVKTAIVVVLLFILAGAGLLLYESRMQRGQAVEVGPSTGQLSENIDIDIYLDGSGSMKHFLTPEAKVNTFREFLRNCEFALTAGTSQGGWQKRSIRFWKFGPKIPERLDKNGTGNEGTLREAAESPGWFNAPDTPIGDAFLYEPPPSAPNTGRLRIAITDLYQSDGKLEIPAAAIGRKYLSGHDGAVAIYGVRNPYQGGVDDLPGYPGKALPDAATSMPFYIIIAGENAADVRHAQDLLTSGEYGAPLHLAANEGRLFATYFSKDAGTFNAGAVTYDPHVFRDGGDSMLHFSTDPMLRPRPGEEGAAEAIPGHRRSFSAKVLHFEPDHALGISEIVLAHRALKQNRLGVSWAQPQAGSEDAIRQTEGAEAVAAREWKVRALYCEVKKAGEVCSAPMHDDEAAQGFSFCSPTPDIPRSSQCVARGNPALAVMVDRQSLKGGRQYLIEFDQTGSAPAGNFDAGSKLMRKWNMRPDEVYDLVNRGDRKFSADASVAPDGHPGKTPNLAQFLSALSGFVTSSKDVSPDSGVRLKTFYLYVNAR